MNDEEIEALGSLVDYYMKFREYGVAWNPEDDKCRRVIGVGMSPEEDPEPCAFFRNGTWAALYACEYTDFKIITTLPTPSELIKATQP